MLLSTEIVQLHGMNRCQGLANLTKKTLFQMSRVFPLGSQKQLDARTMRDDSPSCNFTASVLCLQQLEQTFVWENTATNYLYDILLSLGMNEIFPFSDQ